MHSLVIFPFAVLRRLMQQQIDQMATILQFLWLGRSRRFLAATHCRAQQSGGTFTLASNLLLEHLDPVKH